METVLRVLVIYVILMVTVRLTGKRTLAEATTFDFLVLLVISETLQPVLVGNDPSIITAALTVATFFLITIGLAHLKLRSATVERLLEDVPTVLVRDGVALKDRMRACRVDLLDVLEAARVQNGVLDLEQIRYAILERTGEISIIERDASKR